MAKCCDFWQNSAHLIRHLNETNPASLFVGGAALVVLVLGKIFLPNKPVAMVVVLGGIVASSVRGLEARGVQLLGEVLVAGLLKLSTLVQFWRSDRVEFMVAMAALLGVLGIFRPESSLLYFNIDHICDAILAGSTRDTPPPQRVILDLSAAPYVDMQSAHTLADLARELRACGISVQAVGAHAAVRDRLRKEGVDALLGRVNRHRSIADAIEDANEKIPPG